jgi:hypothetical protein
VTDGNEHGRHGGAESKSDADRLAAVDQICRRPALVVQRPVSADENRLCATNRRSFEHDAAVAGKAEASRMGVADTVEDDHVRFCHQGVPRALHRRQLAE